MHMSLLVYLAVVVGVSPVVLWWNEAKQLVYMALVVRVSSVLLWWRRGRLVNMALVVKFVLVRLCFGRCRTARHLWQYVQVRAPLWVFRGEYLVLLWIVIHSHTDIIP
eukprot:scaffold8135_cov77-Skeletonema_marinoi.AAC.1